MGIRYGIIGCGNISRFHFNALRKINARVTWIADINKAAAEERAGEWNAEATDDYDKLISSEDVDVVCILGPASIHRDTTLKAIAAKKHVICEKTMTNSEKDAIEILRASRKSGRFFFTSYMKRFYSAAVKAQSLLPQLGKVYSAYARSYQAWGNFYTDGHGWDLNAVLKNFGGAVTKCAGSHMIDMILWLLGRPDSVYANINFYPGSKFDRRATAVFEYDNDMTVTFETLAHPLRRVGYERNSWDEYIEINGTAGRLALYTTMWDHPENNGALLVHYDDQTQSSAEYRFEPENPFDLEIAYFDKCMSENRAGKPDAEDGCCVDVIIERMFQAAREKRSVVINWKEVFTGE
jgi:predicted dehydrogenase